MLSLNKYLIWRHSDTKSAYCNFLFYSSADYLQRASSLSTRSDLAQSNNWINIRNLEKEREYLKQRQQEIQHQVSYWTALGVTNIFWFKGGTRFFPLTYFMNPLVLSLSLISLFFSHIFRIYWHVKINRLWDYRWIHSCRVLQITQDKSQETVDWAYRQITSL